MAGYLVFNASGKIVSEVIDDQIMAMARVIELNKRWQTDDYWYDKYNPDLGLTRG